MVCMGWRASGARRDRVLGSAARDETRGRESGRVISRSMIMAPQERTYAKSPMCSTERSAIALAIPSVYERLRPLPCKRRTSSTQRRAIQKISANPRKISKSDSFLTSRSQNPVLVFFIPAFRLHRQRMRIQLVVANTTRIKTSTPLVATRSCQIFGFEFDPLICDTFMP